MSFSFGSVTTTGSTFGTTTPSTGFSFASGDPAKAATIFGSPNTDNKPSFNFSSPPGNFSFGAKTTAATTSLFASPTATEGGLGANKAISFGAPPNQTVGSPGFGQLPQTIQQPFGSGQQSTPAPAFGSPSTQASSFSSPGAGFAFGKPATTTAPPPFGFSTPASGFGQPQPTVQPAATTALVPQGQSAFGGTPAFGQSSFGAKPGFSFGGTSTPASTPAPAFGAATTTAGSGLSFGAPQPSFGGNAQATPAAAPSFGAATGTGATTALSSFSFTSPSSQPNTGLGFGTQPTSQPATGLGFGTQPTPQPSSGLSFGTQPTSQPASGLGFGTQPATGLGFGTQPTSQPSTGLGFGTQPTSQPSTGLGFGTQPTSQPSTGLGFGTQPTSQPSGGLNFGGPTSQPSTGLNFGTSIAQSAPQGTSFSTPTTAQPTTSLSFGTTPATTALAPAGLSFPTTTSGGATLGGFGTPASTASQPSGLMFASFAKTTSSSQPTTTISFGSTPASTAAQPSGSGFAATPASSSQTTAGLGSGLGFGIKTTAAATTGPLGVGFGSTIAHQMSVRAKPENIMKLTSTSAPSGITALGTSSANTSMSAATTTTTTAAAPPQPIASITFAELEENINKWTLELEEQEKTFINQATQINAWDRLLISNGEKIVELNETVETVKNEQQNLEHELEFVLAQQKELEDLIAPMEKQILDNSGDRLRRDPEREHMYSLAENLDTQLRQMSEDLKEVIEHLNDTNRGQDSNDPIVQIGRILNTHMSSMQWIDNSIAQISNKLDQLKATHDTLRRDNERSFQLTYN